MIEHRKKIIIILVSGLFISAFVLSASDIHFEVNNNKLEANIDQYSEDKENLRATYLSRISLHKLGETAVGLKMQHAGTAVSYSVSKKESIKQRKSLEKLIHRDESVFLVSGY